MSFRQDKQLLIFESVVVLAVGFGTGTAIAQLFSADDTTPAAKVAKWCAKYGLKAKAFKKYTSAVVVIDDDSFSISGSS